jgi:hypothetical protein
MAANVGVELVDPARPNDMPQLMYEQLCSNYQRARGTYNKSVARNSRTVAANLRVRNEEHAKLMSSLERWTSSTDVRAAVAEGLTSTTDAITALTAATNQATNQQNIQNQNVLVKLVEIQTAIQHLGQNSSPSSSSTDVVMQPVEEVPSDVCMICHDDSPDGPAMPCCFQGNHKACLSCYAEYIVRNQDFKCPHCRTAFKDCVPVGDAAALGRLSGFICALYPTHEKVVEALVNCRTEPRKLVILRHLEAFNTPEGPRPRQMLSNLHVNTAACHVELEIVYDHQSLSAPSEWGSFYVAEETVEWGHPMRLNMPLQFLSAPGDDIHDFVNRACGGEWFHHNDFLEIRVKGAVYPHHYYFDEFKRIRGGETVMVLSVDYESTDDVGPVEFPFSAIESCKSYRKAPIMFHTEVHNPELPRHVAIWPWGERWQRCYVKEVLRGGYGSRLVLAAYPESLYTRTIYDSMVTAHVYLRDVGQEIEIVGVPEEQPDNFRVRLVCSHTCPAEWRGKIDPNEHFAFLGYTKSYMSFERQNVPCLVVARRQGWGEMVVLENEWVATLIFAGAI